MSELWTRLDPGFLDPIWLLIGVVAVSAVILLEIGTQRRRNQAVRAFAASHLVTALTGSVSPAKRLMKRILLISAVGLLFVAMARPCLSTIGARRTAPASMSSWPSIAPRAC